MLKNAVRDSGTVNAVLEGVTERLGNFRSASSTRAGNAERALEQLQAMALDNVSAAQASVEAANAAKAKADAFVQIIVSTLDLVKLNARAAHSDIGDIIGDDAAET